MIRSTGVGIEGRNNMNKYIKRKLLQNKVFDNFAASMKTQEVLSWVAGGAITGVCTDSLISDYDIYFSDKESCVKAIHYMQEENAHCAFISDKSITYVLSNTTSFRNALGEYEPQTKIQFIFYDYYKTAEEIFSHYDFSCNMGAYNMLTEEFSFHEDFWLHNSQRFLSFNVNTKFPLISGLRVDKYKAKGYSTSRTEMMKILFACTCLKINSWEEFSNQIGNLYGFNFMNVTKFKDREFSLSMAMEILSLTDFTTPHTPCDNYKVDPRIVDIVVSGEIIEYVKVNNVVYATLEHDNVEMVNELLESGNIPCKEVGLKDYLGEYLYQLVNKGDSYKLNEELLAKSYFYSSLKPSVSMLKLKDDLLQCRNNHVILECSYNEEDVHNLTSGYIPLSKVVPMKAYTKEELIGEYTQF